MSLSQGLELKRIPAGKPGDGACVVRLHYSANIKAYPPEVISRLRAGTANDAYWQREMEMKAHALEGSALYPSFSRHVNVCPSFDVSDRAHWTIWQGGDPHMRTPHAFGWVAFSDRGEDVVCGELWPNLGITFTTREYAEAIKLVESDSEEKPPTFMWANGKKLVVYARYMDTHGKAANSDEAEKDYFEAYAGHGIYFDPATKSEATLQSAVDEIRDRFKAKHLVDGVKMPRLRVFEECIEAISEFERVRFPEGDVERPAQERPLTYRKHVIDCIHYVYTAQAGFTLPGFLRGSTADDAAAAYAGRVPR